ncbi:MAG: hypothetical protein D6705_12745 [Deltaproteobacteria bacterium]|nr:MAG: hypothetical protein D6705_12745 [Deltaproteobacteria bacterium]
MVAPRHPRPTRYGCHECREDAESVMAGRATYEVRTQYETHLRRCRDCRRVHRLLLEIYEDPFQDLPEPTPAQHARTFRRILEHTDAHQVVRRRPWQVWHPLPAGLAAATVAAAMTLFLWQGSDTPTDDAGGIEVALSEDAAGNDDDSGGIDHPAQSFARRLAGSASVEIPNAEASTGTIYPVGSRFRVPLHDSLQLTLAGKVVANFTRGTEATWSEASSQVIRVRLDRGLIAMRYDRKPADPVLEIVTPAAVVRVVGTVFTVQVDYEKNTTVSVLRGEVEVLDAERADVLAEVRAGYRYDHRAGTFSDVGRAEVAAALPISGDEDALAMGTVPVGWVVPGLSEDPSARQLSAVPKAEPDLAPTVLDIARTASPRRRSAPEDDGAELLAELMEDAARSRRAEIRRTLDGCREYYADPDERYRAAACLARFLKRYGTSPLAVEGYLLVGMLRMDYALDFDAADIAFEEFLRRAPDHPRAELARYRLWLSAVEDGRISQALERGRAYLRRYPNGRYVGRILQRFPELKASL